VLSAQFVNSSHALHRLVRSLPVECDIIIRVDNSISSLLSQM